MTKAEYRGRIAPSPTGFLHLGHAMTFWHAQERARVASGKLILRIEDIDRGRCRAEYTDAMFEDLRWFGLEWDEGPDAGGPFAPYAQNQRRAFYLEALEQLHAGDFIYPCICSRKDVLNAATAPHDESEEPIYPGTCRPHGSALQRAQRRVNLLGSSLSAHWRFRVRDGEQLSFVDERLGLQTAIAGRDFGDFIVWRCDDVPAYQLAVVIDDAGMQITEAVRDEDLRVSTFRQLLLYRALDLQPPKFFHAPLILDGSGRRFAKRDAAVSLRTLRANGITQDELRSCRRL